MLKNQRTEASSKMATQTTKPSLHNQSTHSTMYAGKSNKLTNVSSLVDENSTAMAVVEENAAA